MHIQELEHVQKEIWYLHTKEGQTILISSPSHNAINIISSNPVACMQVFMLMLCDGMLILFTNKMK